MYTVLYKITLLFLIQYFDCIYPFERMKNIMREKLQTLPMTELREIAKSNGIKSVTTMRKSVLIDKIIEVTDNSVSTSATDNKISADAPINTPISTPISAPIYSTPNVTPQLQTYTPQAAAPTYSHQEIAPRVQSYNNPEPPRTQPYVPSYANNNNYESRPRTYANNNGNNNYYDRNQERTPARTYDRPNYDRPQTQDKNYRDNNNRTYDRPSYDRPSYDRPSYDRPGFDRPSYDKPSYDKPAYDKPSYDKPVYDKPTYERPSYEKNSDDGSFDPSLDSGLEANGILEVMPDGFGFIRCENYLPGDHDIYVSPMQIRKLNLKTGDNIVGKVKVKSPTEKFAALLCLTSINEQPITDALVRPNFEDLVPIFPNERISMETSQHNMAMRILDIVSPIGKGQRGMIVSPPKAGKTTLLKEIARSISINNPEMHMIILLIDERPEEVTDIKEAIQGENVEVIYSTFDELPDHHKRVSEMVIERGKRLVEHGKDVVILLDSITRLARAYNLVVPPSGRTLSGGLDPAALHMPKKFFGAARNMRDGGSLTILATALVETGSKMDDVVFEEFKGTGNMELVLNRKLSERRVFPAIDILKSGTRRDDLLLTEEEAAAADVIKKASATMRPDDSVESILNVFTKTSSNAEFCQTIVKQKI